jgi:hypothetical protein
VEREEVGLDKEKKQMTDIEFDILDELYFIKTFAQLQAVFNDQTVDLEQALWQLVEKDWVKIVDGSDQEIKVSKMEYCVQKDNLRFNATKSGLKAHNQV